MLTSIRLFKGEIDLMAIRNIRVDDDPILRKTSRQVTEFNDRLFDLLDDMKETLYKSGGVGLAAPQVGV